MNTIDKANCGIYDRSDMTGTEGEASVDRLLAVKEICELLKVKKTYIYWLTHQSGGSQRFLYLSDYRDGFAYRHAEVGVAQS